MAATVRARGCEAVRFRRVKSSAGSPAAIVRAFVISLGQSSGCVGWVAHRLLAPCSVLGVAVKPVLLTYLLTIGMYHTRTPVRVINKRTKVRT